MSQFLSLSDSKVGRDAAALEGVLQAAPTAPAPVVAPPDVQNLSLEDLSQSFDTPLSQQSFGLKAPGALDAPKGSLWDAVWQAEGTWNALGDIFATHGFQADSQYRLPELDSDEWKAIVGDLPPDYWDDLGSAVSLDHFKALANVARKNAEAEQTIASYGGAGVAGRIGAAMLDPVSLAVGLGTGSLGFLAKGTRVAKALKIAGVAAAENAAIESALAVASPGRDGHDVAYAALAGFALGGSLGYLLSRSERAAVIEAGTAEAGQLAAREAADLVPEAAPRLRATPRYQTVDQVTEQIDAVLPATLADDAADAAAAPRLMPAQARRITEEAEKALVRAEMELDAMPSIPDRVGAIEARMAAEDAASGNPSTAKMRRKAAVKEATEEFEADKAAREKALDDAEAAYAQARLDRDTLETAVEARKRLKAAGKEGLTPEEKIALISDPELRGILRGRLMTARAIESLPKFTPENVPSMEEIITRSPDRDTSVGAADTGAPIDRPLREVPERDVEVAETKFRGLRFDLAATLRGAVRGARNLVGRYVGDSVGAVDGQITEIGASEIAARHHERLLAKFYSALTPTYEAWAKDTGRGFLARWGRKSRSDFNKLVTQAIRNGDVTDPHAAKAATQIKAVFADVLAEAKAAGVKGFENVAEKGSYVPRVFNYQKFRKLLDKHGEDGVYRLIRGAIRSNVPEDELDDVALDLVARGYVMRLREVSAGLDTTVTHGISMKDTDSLAALMQHTGADRAQVDEVIGRLKAMIATSDNGQGSVRYGKRRVDLDENFSMEIGGEQVRVDDLFENDIEHLMGRYLRSMSGHIGMAKIGVRSFADHKKNLEGLAEIYEHDLDGLKKVRDAADTAYKLVTGQPIEDLGTAARWSRFLRDYNFARTMNQAGFAQIPDLAGIFSSAYLRHTLRHLPELGRMMRRGADGKLRDEFARELEEFLGVGTDYHNVAVFSMFDLEADGFAGALGTAEHALRVMGRGTQAISGMASITAAAQRLAAKSIVQRFVSGKISVDRLAAVGIDPDMMVRIRKMMDDNVQTVSGDAGGKVKAVNFSKWSDTDARDAFLQAVHKTARRLVQEEDVGDTAAWMHKSVWKMAIQFRRFGIVSYTKQLMNGVSHADAEATTHMMMSFALAGAAYWAQQQVRMAGMTPSERRRWEKKYVTENRIAAAAFARSSFSSIIPAVIDTPLSIVLGVRAFDVRASGQASDLIQGISTVDAANKWNRVLSKSFQSVLRDDRQWTQSDLDALKGILPYGNSIPLQFGYESLVKPGLDLPRKQRGGKKDEVNWSFD